MTNHQHLGLMAGASGALGKLIADRILDEGAQLRILVRPDSRKKPEVAALEARGAEIIEGDLQQSVDQLAAYADGTSFVVSAVQGGPDIIVDGQLRLLEAAKKVQSVRRFVPSDFSYDLFALKEGDNINSDWRRRFATEATSAIAGTNVRLLHILNGCFLDRRVLFGFLGAIDLEQKIITVWGEPAAKMDFTTYEDTARYTAAAVLDSRDVPTRLQVAGDVLSFEALKAAYEDATPTGQKLEVKRLGSFEDLDREIASRQQKNPANVFGYLPLMYYRAMLTGKAKLRELHNDRYPHIQPTTVENYVKQEGL